MAIVIKNGIVMDPASKTEKKADVFVAKGKIVKIAEKITEEADQVIDAKGCYVMPGFIDLHVHLRDPGLEYKETIETGGAAAAHGGVTTIVAMPNTKPVVDNPDVVNYITNKADVLSDVHVLQAGAVTRGMHGTDLSDIEGMAKAGIAGISEDGKSVMNSQLCKEAMQKAAELNIPVFAHCEDSNLVNGGVMNDDEIAKKFGLRGISNSVENIIIARDIMLAKDTGVALHLCHCSTKESVQMVKEAKEAGIRVTAEVCPHHFTLTSSDIVEFDTNYKMNPPLRKKEDVEALKEGLKEGIMDIISTDHAPHSFEEKHNSFERAPFGIVGLETSASLTYTELVKTGVLTLMQMVEKMSYNPAQVLGSDKGVLQEGRTADIVIFDTNAEYDIDPSTFRSKGKNTPFAGRHVFGKVMATIVDGEVVYDAQREE
ncbi:MAG: dihydroorotase [Lachnospiraceae bacterium]